ncbi:uncharacterized protein LOC110726017 [Chenopodium quinoa]|uniref:uncharacterized protein LOC110726017 n=1 Tax=Chenopodium quinoa TaxID=63459 RepID=UPI000B786A71|nr:uncharacterized protein LOC110726017 [Chenopodium quinoa]
MAAIDEDPFFDIEHLISEEEIAEMYYDYEEQMQDADFEAYNSDNENMKKEAEIEDTTINNNNQTQQDETQASLFKEGTHQPNRKQLNMHQKREIVDAMLLKMQDGNLPRGYKVELSIMFKVHKSTITRLFNEIKRQMAEGNLIDVRSKKIGRTGPKPMELSDEFLQSVPLHLRQTERSYAAALNISHVTLHYLKKKGRIRTHTASSKPALTSDHKVARMKWVLSHINPIQGNENPTFDDMKYSIHIDEKWFYLNPDKRRFYLLPSEKIPIWLNNQGGSN